MKRRLANAFLACCVLVAAAAAAMWVRSYWRMDQLTHAQPGRQSAVASVRGRIVFDTMGDAHVPLRPRAGVGDWFLEKYPLRKPFVIFIDHPSARARRFLGFAYADVGSVGYATRRLTALAIPYWSIVLTLAIAPTTSLLLARRRRWKQLHRRCLTCGYDLRATPDRCPECGTAIGD